MAVESLQDLLLDELKDIYSAEKQSVRVYPRLAKAIESEELKEALQGHLEETKEQVERLDQVFEKLEKRGGGKTCEAMKGLIEEGQEILEEVEAGPVRDAALIGAAQRMEHYEIAAYGTVISLAKALGHEEVATLLGQTLEEEKRTDEKLTQISESVNRQALESSDDDDENDEDAEDAEDEDAEDEDLDEELDDDEEDDEEDEEDEDEEEDEAPPPPAKKAATKAPAKKSPKK